MVENKPPRRGSLTISDLAAATNVSAATLRSWEERHGYPRPHRLPGGHRRYDLRDVAVIRDVVRRRDSGQLLSTAIAAALAHDERPEGSVFAALRRRHPHLAPRRVRKPTMLALSRALEDESCARAENPVLFGAFQQGRFFEQSRVRWEELARTARSTVVFASFGEVPESTRIRYVDLADDAPMQREWVLVCAADDHPGCAVSWEIPGSGTGPDEDRRFEVLWSVEPRVVRDAARICAGLAGPDFPASGVLDDVPPEASPDLRRAQGLLERTLAYLDRSDDRARD
jgi:DNA-binding transcriptional MerR regulator